MPQATVTGASGYVGGALCAELLKREYSVVAIVRNPESPSIAHLKTLQELYPDCLRLAHVADLTKLSDAFNGALKGSGTLFHCASPIGASSLQLSDDEFLNSAVEPTEVAMRAAAAAGCTRVVLTSSMAAVVNNQAQSDPNLLYSESCWSDEAPFGGRYQESKARAERAAWKLVAELPGLELATVNPGLVLGPTVPDQPPRSTNIILLEMANGVLSRQGLRQACSPEIVHRPPSSVVHIEDVVDAHVRAAEEKEAAGQRFCVASRDQYTVLEIAKKLKEMFPGLDVPTKFADDVPQDALRVGRKPNCDSSKVEALLGRPLHSLETVLRDGISAMTADGLLSPPA